MSVHLCVPVCACALCWYQVNVFKSITAKIGRFQRWGPTIAGLAVIPFLPVFLDEPAEQAVEWVFHKAWPVPGKH